MINRNTILTVGLVILIILVAGADIYVLGSGDKTNNKLDTSKELTRLPPVVPGPNQTMTHYNQPISPDDPSYVYGVISSLDKENCSKVKTQRQALCIDGINLIQNALAAKNVSLCFNGPADVDQKTIMICTMRLNSQILGDS